MKPFRRLFFDIEVSYCIGWFWRPGSKVSIGAENIIKESAIICICYKWDGESKIHSLTWDNGDDKNMIEQFAPIINSADEVCAHNGDKFDVKWFRTRCLKHRVLMTPFIKSIDTLKESRLLFNHPSNKLDYLGKYHGIGSKVETPKGLWDKVILNNDQDALKKMVKYCKGDVKLLQDYYNLIKPYSKVKTNCAIKYGREVVSCPECLSSQTNIHSHKISASGMKSTIMKCKDCGKYFSVSTSRLERHLTAEYLKKQMKMGS